MKLLVLSDLHIEFAQFVPDESAAAAADIVVLAGDIHQGDLGIAWARYAFPDKPVVYVAGNHELYGQRWETLNDHLRDAGRFHDVHFLENESVTISGVRFVGCTLWTDFEYLGPENRSSSMHAAEKGLNDYRVIEARPLPEIYWRTKKHRLTAHHTLKRHRQSRAWLESELAKGDREHTVAVVHHCVHANSVATRYRDDVLTPAFASHLPLELLMQSPLWIHGHTHDSFDYQLDGDGGSTRIVCNPRGYPLSRRDGTFENSSFESGLLVEFAGDSKEEAP